MGAGSVVAKTVGGVVGVAAAAIATGVVVERNVVRKRKDAGGPSQFFSLSSEPRKVVADDDIELYAEIDEVAPYAGKAEHEYEGPTLLFIHGYALNLHCWYFQREAFRGKYRMAFYDQRSHGRSDVSDLEHATMEQLGDDLRAVLEQLVPDGPVVLVGHSMGGMAIQAFAEAYPDVFADRVIGTALISTSTGGLHPHRTLSRLIPDRIGEFATPRIVAALASAPELIDSARRGSNVGYLAASRFAYGGEVPVTEVEFVDEMLASTPMAVIAQFFEVFDSLDLTRALHQVGTVPTTVICGTRDKLTSIGHSRKMAALMPGSRLVEVEGAGHMVIVEDRELVNAELDKLVGEAVARSGTAARSRG